MNSQFGSYPEELLFGSGVTPASSFGIGFGNSNQLLVTNIKDTIKVTTPSPVDQYKLYTIRFSQSNGIEVFINGSLTPVAADPAMTQALTSFLSTRIGSKNGNTLYIAELKAYGVAVSELQRKSLDKALLIKYGL